MISRSTNVQTSTNLNRFNKRIGSVTYDVGIHFNFNANETFDDKIIRMIKNEMGAVS